jgi:hypothetical protein
MKQTAEQSIAAKSKGRGFPALLLEAEFVCWILIFLVPIMQWVNGSAVTSDQAAIRFIVLCAVVINLIGMRLIRIRCGRGPSHRLSKRQVCDNESRGIDMSVPERTPQ